MTQQSPAAVLERLLQANELGWLIGRFGSRERAFPVLLKQLEQVATEYRSRLGESVSFSPETLERESIQNPHKVRAFLQAFCATSSPKMLVMVWRILRGLSIREVAMTYHERGEFHLKVVLAHQGVPEAPYESDDINHAALLRHFGIMTISERPLFEGFYPLRLKDDRRSPS